MCIISQRQTSYLEYISKFSTDIKHKSGTNNVVVDALLRIFRIYRQDAITINKWQKHREKVEDLQLLKTEENTTLNLKTIEITKSNTKIVCDISEKRIKTYVPDNLIKSVFNKIYYLSHPGFENVKNLKLADIQKIPLKNYKFLRLILTTIT